MAASYNSRGLLEFLIKRGVVQPDDRKAIQELIKRYPDTWIDKLLNSPYVISADFFKALAKFTGILLYTTEELSKSKLARLYPYTLLKKYTLLPVKHRGKTAIIATHNPFNRQMIKELKAELGPSFKPQFVMAKPQDINRALDESYQLVHGLRATSELVYRFPKDSAYKVLTPWQRYTLIVSLFLLLAWFILDYPATLIFIFAAINLSYFILNPAKFLSILLVSADRDKGTVYVREEELKRLDEEKLPVYTILVPLYKEGRVLPRIIRHLQALDYPVNKKDIKIILEENDVETIQKAGELGLLSKEVETRNPKYPGFEVLIAPSADIKTKPRACNYALQKAKGEFVVIYDAEDKPEADQLKKAVVAFRKIGPETVCLQAMLNFYNTEENMLTKWFTIEYTSWFDYYLPSLEKIKAPIPLGGTSNHFRIQELKNLGSWDPYNVTEDADLGVRIYKTELKTAMLNSHTYEEANSRLWNWIRQRSRWEKGFIQTYLVTMRYPRELIRKIGLRKFILLHLTFGANTLLPLLNPLLWAITMTTLISVQFFSFLFLWPLSILFIINLALGNLFYILFHMLAVWRRGQKRLVPYTVLLPLYWMLISIAAWKGLVQLFTNPFYWEKTNHGISTIKVD